MSKPPLLFIHGFPLDHEMWRHQEHGLSWPWVSADLWGAGTANIPASAPEHSVAEHAADLIRSLPDLEVDDVIVCGLSMGGYIAFELLRTFPERVKAAILCNTKAAADTPDARRRRDEMAAQAEREGMGAIAADLVPKLLARATREHEPAVVREVTEMIRRQPVHGVIRALRALRDRPDSTPLLAQIQIPVLVIAGEDDHITPAAEMGDMAGAIPNAEFLVIPDAGHLTPLEQPRAFNAAITGFLKQLG